MPLLYALEHGEAQGYLSRPQSMLYAAVHVHRTYAPWRAVALYSWMQDAGLRSTLTDKGLFHDRFNAMEAVVYLKYAIDRLMNPMWDDTHCQQIVLDIGRRAVLLAFDPEAKTLFIPSYEHRWTAVHMLALQALQFGRATMAQQWLELLLDPSSDVPLKIRQSTRQYLAEAYVKDPSRQPDATTLCLDMLLDQSDDQINAAPADSKILLDIARATKDLTLAHLTIEIWNRLYESVPSQKAIYPGTAASHAEMLAYIQEELNHAP